MKSHLYVSAHGFSIVLVSFAVVATCFASLPMTNLPRNMNLKPFDPHRKEFICKHEIEALGVMKPEAEALFQRGLNVTSFDLYPDKRDYKTAAQLWEQAASLGHWKAALNLSELFMSGSGVARNSEKALVMIETLMIAGVPSAFDRMGAYHQRGMGVKASADRAYAFWQLAAEMGSPSAQGRLGAVLDGTYDHPAQGSWGNRPIALKMLECGMAQGDHVAAFELGTTIVGNDESIGENYERALQALHESVRLGSEAGASYLAASFRQIQPLSKNAVDLARAERYSLLSDALLFNPDLRFPNLDKVLPLPPAELPTWDGKRQTLIDAAKGLVVPPKVVPTPGSRRTGRAHIPQGQRIAAVTGETNVFEQHQPVPATGYWLPQLKDPVSEDHHAWQRLQVPQHYKLGEAFDALDRSSLGGSPHRVPRTVWRYVGPAEAVPEIIDPRVARGVVRHTREPEPPLHCLGALKCPRTGVWRAEVRADHALANLFNVPDRTDYIEEGRAFPDPGRQYIPIEPHEVKWRWLDNANQINPSGHVIITLTDLHEGPR